MPYSVFLDSSQRCFFFLILFSASFWRGRRKEGAFKVIVKMKCPQISYVLVYVVFMIVIRWKH